MGALFSSYPFLKKETNVTSKDWSSLTSSLFVAVSDSAVNCIINRVNLMWEDRIDRSNTTTS